MNKFAQNDLRQELLSTGAGAAEADELTGLAGRLRVLRAEPKAAPVQRTKWQLSMWPATAVAVVALVFGMAVVAFSQNSLPGNWLYPVKRASENAAVAVAPGYRATLMMRRADEVRQLVADNAPQARVSSTLHEYQVEASSYKGSNYPAFEYCKSNLKTAEKSANASEKQLIDGVLQNLGDAA